MGAVRSVPIREGTRRLLGVVSVGVALGIFLCALWILRREIEGRGWAEIRAAAGSLPAAHVAACVFFTAASYAQLVCYDFLALRYAGRRLALPRVMFASLTAYVASHNLGLAGVGGTAVRARLYSAWGLTAVEIAQVVAFCTVTFWTGVLLLGGVAFLAAPLELSESLPPIARSMRVTGVLLLVGLGGYLLLVFGLKKGLRFRGWSFSAPSPGLVAGQLLTACVDWMLSAAVVYSVLPPDAGVPYLTFLVIFLVAQIAGMLSHVPGGLGVFEGVLLLALPDTIEPESLLAGLLVYRAIYFLVPLALGSVSFATYEVLQRRADIERTGRRLRPVVAAVLPDVAATTAFVLGLLLLFLGASPIPLAPLGPLAPLARVAESLSAVPLPRMGDSMLLGSLLGGFLIVLARAVHRRLDAAWWVAVGGLGLWTILSFVHGLRIQPMILAACLLAFLASRHEFRRRGVLLHRRFAPSWWVLVVAVVAGCAWVGAVAYGDAAASGRLWWTFVFESTVLRDARTGLGLGCLTVLAAAAQLLKAAPGTPRPPSAAELEEARAILARRPAPHGRLLELGDKYLLFSRSREAFVMYTVEGSTWIALGNPIGSAAERYSLVAALRALADRYGGACAFLAVGEEDLPLYAAAELGSLQVGEEAALELSPNEPPPADDVEVVAPDQVDALLPELRAISTAWLQERERGEFGFAVASFTEPLLRSMELLVVRDARGPVGFAALWSAEGCSEAALDLVRTRRGSEPEAGAKLIRTARSRACARGAERLVLGGVALAGLEPSEDAPVWGRLASVAFRYGEHVDLDLSSYRAELDRAGAAWSPLYLATDDPFGLPAVLVNVARCLLRDPTEARGELREPQEDPLEVPPGG